MTMKNLISILVLVFLTVTELYSQSNCATAKRIWLACNDSIVSTTGTGTYAEVGPNYSCLTTQPNPNWFYFKAETNGTVSLLITQFGVSNDPTDVDYICWGPFANENFCGNLTNLNVMGCSYSASASENVNLTVQAGSYYVLMTTNFADVSGKTHVSSNSGTAQIHSFSVMVDNDSLCAGSSVELVASGAQSFLWNGTISNDTLVDYPPMSLTYTVSGTHELGCVAFKTKYIEVGQKGFYGAITYSGGSIDQGKVHVLQYQPTYSGNDTVSSVVISPLGTFYKGAIGDGLYLLKADPDTTVSSFSQTISTYNGGAFIWDSAVPILHSCFVDDTINIQVLELPVQNGTASVSGQITEGDGYGQRLMNPINNPFQFPGGPLKGIDVKLGRNPGGGVQSRTTTDINGDYEFTNIPVGNYKIYVDIPNLPMDSTREISVTGSTTNISDNDYVADSVKIYIPISSVGIKKNKMNDGVLIAYPNPFAETIYLNIELSNVNSISYELQDCFGKLLMSEIKYLDATNHLVSIDTKRLNLKSGVYFMKVSIGSECRVIKLFKS